MWTKIAGWILRYRIFCISSIIVLTGLIGYQIRHIEMSYENAQLLPQQDSAYIAYDNFIETFGQEGDVMVLALRDSSFFELPKINDWIRLGNEIKKIPGVTAFLSIAHTYQLQKNTEFQKFEAASIFPDSIQTQQQLDSIVQIAVNQPFYDGILMNRGTYTYGAMITVAKEVMNSPARVPLVQAVRELTDAFAEEYSADIHYSGMPYIRVVNAENTKQEMYLFIALSLMVTTVILLMFFRSPLVVGFCVVIIGISVVWALGFMAMLDIKITLLTAMLPPLLIVIGIPNCVFMINKYQAEYIHHGNKIKALQRVIKHIGNATLLSNVTTAAGFATFIITSSQILKDFGLIAFMSITSEFFICLIMVPAVFSFLPTPNQNQTRHMQSKFHNIIISKLINMVTMHRKAVYVVMGVVLLTSVVGIFQMKTTGYMVDDLKETDPIRQDLAFLEDNFNGLMPLEVSLDFKKKNQAFNLSNLEKVERMSKEIQQDTDISRPVSLIEAAKFVNQSYYNGNPAYYKLPTKMTQGFIMKYVQNSASGNALGSNFSSFVDSTASKLRITYRVKDVGTNKMEAKEDSLYAIIHRIFPPDKVESSVTGSSVLFFKGTQYMMTNLFSSLALAVLLIAGFMASMFKSTRMVIVSLIPNIIPLIITAAIMGFVGIPIKTSTILVFSIAFGISVDDTIHFLAKYRQELQSSNWSIRTSVIIALRETGQSMMYTSIILFFGFGIFCLSDFGGTFALGALMSITLCAAMFSNLVILPSLLLTLEKSLTSRSFKEPYLQIFSEEEDIDLDKLRIEKREKE